MQLHSYDPAELSRPRVFVIADDPVARHAFVERLEGLVVGSSDSAPTSAAPDRHGANVYVWDLGPRVADVDAKLVAALPFEGPTVVLLPEGSSGKSAFVAAGIDPRAIWGAAGTGVLGRAANAKVIRAAIDGVMRGLNVFDPEFVPDWPLEGGRTPATDPESELTRRELEVLEHMAVGDSNRKIAEKLRISPHTVKFHINAILTKLDVHTRTEAVVRAIQAGHVML